MGSTPVFTSKCTAKSLWQEYVIYDDRIEFGTLFGKMTVPFEEIEGIAVSESEIRGLLKGDLHLKGFRPALKLDWANFKEHVVLDKNSGHIRRILFTPDDPEKFRASLNQALTDYRDKDGH
jgi:hypothetical protein